MREPKFKVGDKALIDDGTIAEITKIEQGGIYTEPVYMCSIDGVGVLDYHDGNTFLTVSEYARFVEERIALARKEGVRE